MAEEVTRKPYVRELPRVSWFLRQARYVRYMTRELSCIFIGAYTLLLVVGLKRLAEGQAAYESFLAGLRTPAAIVFHGVALAFALYHSVTWFNLTPKALPIQMGDDFLPGPVIAGAHYALWAVLSLAVLVFAGAF